MRMESEKKANGTLDELTFSHIFDYNAIEQIANGLEKMVQSWSSRPEETQEQPAAAEAAPAPTAAVATSTSDINTAEALENFARVLERSHQQQQQQQGHETPVPPVHKNEYVKVEPYTVGLEPQLPSIPSSARSPPAKSNSNYQPDKENARKKIKENGRIGGVEKKGLVEKRISRRVEEVLRRSVACRTQAKACRSVQSNVSSSPERRTAAEEAGSPRRRCISPAISPRMSNGPSSPPFMRLSSPSCKLSPTPLKHYPQTPFEEDESQNLCALSDMEQGCCNFEHMVQFDRHPMSIENHGNHGNGCVPFDSDTFMATSTYWRVERDPSSREEQQQCRPQDCSFVNDALYERADFSTSYEERPLKRKKKTLRSFSHERELENDDLALAAPLVRSDDRCEQTMKHRHAQSAFSRMNVPGPGGDSKEMYKSKVEELQIALLECAAEYEVKMVEMEMKMLQLKSKYQLQEQETTSASSVKSEKEWTTRRLENYRRHNLKLQREKEALAKELADMKKKERQIDLLRKNLEDSLQKVNSLQREMVKKEEELVDSQLKEKEAKAHLYQVEAALQHAEASKIDHGGVLNLLQSLSQWLHGVKKASFVKFDARHQLQIQQYEESLAKLMEECLPQPRSPSKIPQLGYIGWDALTQGESPPDTHEVNREVQALQDELERLACRRSTF